jgi:predicted dehydrogenase
MTSFKQVSRAGGRTLGVGILGYGMMGRAHSSAFSRLPPFFQTLPVQPRLVAIAGRNQTKTAELGERFGYDTAYGSWQDLIADDRVQIFDNTGPNHLHLEPCISAARLGKHVLCEKPLARNAEEAFRMLRAVEDAGVVHMCGFNYRFIPAVRLAKQLLDAGKLGRIFHFRARYLQPSLVDPAYPFKWRMDREQAGAGVLADMGSHIIDIARFLIGEPNTICGATATFIEERPREGDATHTSKVTVDDAFQAMVQFDNAAMGVLEGSKMALGSQNRLEFEVNGSDGSLQFDMERMNELRVYLREDERAGLAGFRDIVVTGADHPFMSSWWPRHPIGWEQTFIHEMAHLMNAIGGNGKVAPFGATFEDGYRAAVISDAILASAESGSKVKVEYRASA